MAPVAVKSAAAHNRGRATASGRRPAPCPRLRPIRAAAPYNGPCLPDGSPLWPQPTKFRSFWRESSVAHSSRRCLPSATSTRALDIVQDAMLKLTEKYAGKPAAELPMLFQRILQNTIHDHFRRQKVRSTWTTLLSALGKGDEKDDDFDPLETLPAKSDSNFDGRSRGAVRTSVRLSPPSSTRSSACRRVNGKPFCCVTGKSSMWRRPPRRWDVRKEA